MTQDVNTPLEQDDDFESAKPNFPSKEMLENCLVAVYVTGASGTEPSKRGGTYPWYDTVTIKLDDDPAGWRETVYDKDGDPMENLIPPVSENGPVAVRLRWSTGGMTARLRGRAVGDKAMIGRIDKRKSDKGAAAWSIKPATPADLEIAREHRAFCKAELAKLVEADQPF